MTLPSHALLAEADTTRARANAALDETTRASPGQLMTPAVVAGFMASMFRDLGPEVRLLDAGAGVGSLTAALVHEALSRSPRPRVIDATAYEVDAVMLSGLREVFDSCGAVARRARSRFVGRVVERDFIEQGASWLDPSLFRKGEAPRFNVAILNPPYRKIGSQSRERLQLRAAGIETSNLYAAFVGLAIRLLEPGGELVAITPRSFCNGPYFRPFRRLLLDEMTLLRIHVFENRKRAFRTDAVLQENIIFHAKKGSRRGRVVLSSSAAPGKPISERSVPHGMVVDPKDANAFIHIATSCEDGALAERMASLPCALADLGITVSTDRVVDFRARHYLRDEPGRRTVPLIYPTHFNGGYVAWPKPGGRKANALADEKGTQALMVPNETYVLTKRFTSKEERRRVVAVVCDPSRFPAGVAQIGIENHVNYFHLAGRGLPERVARGLAAYLDSSLVDRTSGNSMVTRRSTPPTCGASDTPTSTRSRPWAGASAGRSRTRNTSTRSSRTRTTPRGSAWQRPPGSRCRCPAQRSCAWLACRQPTAGGARARACSRRAWPRSRRPFLLETPRGQG